MIRLAVDLHIHSALSPCADDSMTPQNIANMSALKELDAISVTDHNSASNLAAVNSAAAEAGVLFVPGIEVQTREEVHVLCYFPSCDAAIEVAERIYKGMMPIKNRADIFGRQLVMDSCDNIVCEEERLLLQSSQFSLEELVTITLDKGGAAVPAHINKTSHSLIANLGFIPENAGFKTVEIYRGAPDIDTGQYRRIFSSDAHYLGDILERESYIEVSEKSVGAIIEKLQCGGK
ncbi:MAG: PHP domain-containing protein [Christensenellales bacterium]|jgi:PHP family Zn ribbon phosphoesterase